MTARIPVYARGAIAAYAIVDADQHDALNAHRWTLDRWGYATRNHKGATTGMHREVAGCEYLDGKVVHHLNEDKLDNRRANLRVFASHSEHARSPHSYWQRFRDKAAA